VTSRRRGNDSIANAATAGTGNDPTAAYTPRFVGLNFTVNF
jgi:hypothetical protein